MSFGKCSVCNSEVIYNKDDVVAKCSICGKEEKTYILCESNHYVCADCCAKEVMKNIREEIPNIKMENPVDIGEYIMAKCGISGHTPHTISAISFLLAVKNHTGKITDEQIEEGLKRGYEIPPGWCGYFGACGAGIGIGVAFSIILGATPSSDKERSIANYATSCCLKKIAQLGGPWCCVGSVRASLKESVTLAEKYLSLKFPPQTRAVNHCWASRLQPSCKKEKCLFYGQ